MTKGDDRMTVPSQGRARPGLVSPDHSAEIYFFAWMTSFHC